MIKKYPIEWLSSINLNNKDKLAELAEKMKNYYLQRKVYYSDIAESESLWIDKNYLPYQEIIEAASQAKQVLEIGCGKSAILKNVPNLDAKYTGIDFSEELMTENRNNHPRARFLHITNPNNYSLPDKSFDLIFSVFVLEHVVFPKKFLEECDRLLSPGGQLIILAPNYLDFGWMASQQVSDTLLSGRDYVRKGNLIAALRAFWYNKIFIPQKCKKLSRDIPGFYININPLCFEVDEFRPDVDAVYIVSEKEIKDYLIDIGLSIVRKSPSAIAFTKSRRLCFIKSTKKV